MEKYFLVKSEALLSLWLACLTLCTVGLDMKTFQGYAVVVQDAMPHGGQIGRGWGVGKRRGWGWGVSSKDCNLGQYKMEQSSPIPSKAVMKVRRSKKRAILASLKWGEGWSRCSIYFVQDCMQAFKVTRQREPVIRN